MSITLLKKGSIVGFLGGLLTTGYIFTAPAAFAEGETEGITLSPVSKHYELDAGGAMTDTIKIINDGQTSYDFIVYARPYTILNSDYNNPNYADAASTKVNADVYKWVTFDQERYHLNPGQSVDVGYKIKVSDNAAPGGHYGVLFAETQSATGQMIGRNKRVGSVIYATIKGDYKTGAEVAKPGASLFQINPPLNAHTSVTNTGNASFIASTTFKVFDIFGGQKYSSQVDQDVMPESTRATVIEWERSPAFGLFKVSIATKALDKQASAETYVFMAPFWFYGIVAILVVGGIMYAVARRRR